MTKIEIVVQSSHFFAAFSARFLSTSARAFWAFSISAAMSPPFRASMPALPPPLFFSPSFLALLR